MPGRGGRRFNIARASRGAEEALWNGNACGRRRRRWQTPSERERKGCVWFGGRVRTGGVSASPFHIHLGSGCDDDEGLLGRGLCLARWMGRDCAWDVVGSRSCPVQVRLGSHFSATQLAAAVTGTRDGKVSPLASHSRTRRPGSPLSPPQRVRCGRFVLGGGSLAVACPLHSCQVAEWRPTFCCAPPHCFYLGASCFGFGAVESKPSPS